MRPFTRFVGFAVAFTLFLHYYCSVNECSNDLMQFCHYSSPKTWHEQLIQESEVYRNNVSPALISIHEEYTNRISPPLLRLGKDLDDRVCKPLSLYVKGKYENFNSQKYLDWIYGFTNSIHRKVMYYYNVFVRPRILKIMYQCKIDAYCAKIHSRIGPFLEKIRFVIHYLKPYTERAKVSLESSYQGLKHLYYKSSHWMGEGIFHSEDLSDDNELSSDESDIESELEKESDLDDENEDDEFYDETETITSTIIVTKTLNDVDGAVASSEPESNDLELNEQEILQEEIKAWFNVIDKQSRNLIKIFNSDVDKHVTKKVELLEPSLKNKTQLLSMKSQKQFQRITKAIQDINCTISVIPETGEIIYFDQSGTTQLSQYITRPLMRTLFNETKTDLETMVQEIKNDLAQFVEEAEKKVKVIRDDILEVYEEWADVMISEWSKRLAYIDVVAGHLDGSDEGSELSSDNWKDFLKLKKQVIHQRDELAVTPAELKGLKEFVNKVEYILNIIVKESGEYTYILRSRANLAFQEREKQEREKFKLEQEAQQQREEIENGEGTVIGEFENRTVASTKQDANQKVQELKTETSTGSYHVSKNNASSQVKHSHNSTVDI